ncbi:MAG TPA: hypothetical protein V6D17_21650 [Candidatus Obscuribacterales bacterium]
MRVELIYRPGCSSYKNVRNTLELVIAEERLPIPVELVEEGVVEEGIAPKIRINGNEVLETQSTIDSLRDLLCRKWKELTECALAS